MEERPQKPKQQNGTPQATADEIAIGPLGPLMTIDGQAAEPQPEPQRARSNAGVAASTRAAAHPQQQPTLELARAPREPTHDGSPAAVEPIRIPPRRRARRPIPLLYLAGGTAVLAVCAGVGVWAVHSLRSRSALSTPAPEQQPQTAVAQTRYVALPVDDAVLIAVDVQPRGATVLLDGSPIESNPLRVPRSSKPHTLSAIADGYEPVTRELVPDQPQTLRLALKRSRR